MILKFFVFITTVLFSTVGYAQKTMQDICPLKVGAETPMCELTDSVGQELTLDSIISDKPSVLVFYRGAWCGYCTKHLAELEGIQQDLDSLGYQMIGITLDQASMLHESNKRAESNINVYSDAKAEATQAFGLDWQVDDDLFSKYKNEYKLDLEAWSGQTHHTLPVPAIYVISEGVVQFQYVNPTYSKRLKAETLLALLETL